MSAGAAGGAGGLARRATGGSGAGFGAEAGKVGRRPWPLAGIALLELVLGLLIFEVGVLAVAALLALSGRVLARAAREERGLYSARTVVDSLAGDGSPTSGEREIPGGRIRWRVSGTGSGPVRIRLNASGPGGRSALSLETLLDRGATPAGSVGP